MDNDDKYVTRDMCAMRTKELSDDIKKQGWALYGKDGRGGMQHDLTKIASSILRIEDKVNNGIKVNHTLKGADWAKIIAAVITTSGVVLIAFLQFVLPLMMGSG